ncbi:capsid protein of prophage [Escherichia coli]|uniref:Capsid protein of prophage n=1 Tax=Escherichia coli TaxID=562 RepID=A0A376KXD4_ECOLX|nr:capsid protein of prophage [Escherichia coli]
MNGELVDIHGQPLRQSMGYSGGGSGFGGQMAEWLPAPESADVALLPSIHLGNARADDLVRNNGIASNAVEIHKDHIVGHMFRLSYRPNWRWLGMPEADSHAFIEDVEAAWMEYCDPVFGTMDVEGRRSFTEFIREGVGVHTFNGEILSSPYGMRNPRHYSGRNSKPSARSVSVHPVMVPAIVLCVPGWK